MKISSFTIDLLTVHVYESKKELGKAASDYAAQTIKKIIDQKGKARIILATGSSQFEFLENFKKANLDWKKITVFHLDEYMGMSDSHPASFRKYLRDRILDKVKPEKMYFLDGDASDIAKELVRYERALLQDNIDIACIGIGENGHIAFNDPPVADFNDSKLVKVVELDELCRKQQLGEGWFPSLDNVPTHALSLTIPAIMRCKTISCVVPDKRKAKAVFETLNDPISTACPASILRKHSNAVLYLDKTSASMLE